MGTDTLFPGFTARRVRTAGAEIACVIGGSGPPLLLLHGYPQTHAMWHKVAPALARDFTVVCADLRGYGDSSKPVAQPDHAQQSKRAMAQDMVEVMRTLGHPRFALAGHDRGGRVAHRLAADHPDAVTRLAVLDISPTRTMYARTDRAFATAYYHWFFLIQPFDLPERLIGADPVWYLRRKIGAWSAGGAGAGAGHPAHFDPRALAEYERCFADPATIHATCEDYRAAASIDLVHDDADVAAGRRVQCPLLALWGDKGVVHRLFEPIADWSEVAVDVRGRALPSGHFLAEEAPGETLSELSAFFAPVG
jgi:haloacetate dehalogenase